MVYRMDWMKTKALSKCCCKTYTSIQTVLQEFRFWLGWDTVHLLLLKVSSVGSWGLWYKIKLVVVTYFWTGSGLCFLCIWAECSIIIQLLNIFFKNTCSIIWELCIFHSKNCISPNIYYSCMLFKFFSKSLWNAY